MNPNLNNAFTQNQSSINQSSGLQSLVQNFLSFASTLASAAIIGGEIVGVILVILGIGKLLKKKEHGGEGPMKGLIFIGVGALLGVGLFVYQMTQNTIMGSGTSTVQTPIMNP